MALTHIKKEVMGESEPIDKVMEVPGFTAPSDFNMHNRSTLETTQYQDSNGKDQLLTASEVGVVRAFQGYIKYRTAKMEPIGLDDWTSITIDQVDEFRASEFCDSNEAFCLRRNATIDLAMIAAAAKNPSLTSPPSTTPGTGPSQRGELQEFRKGIKRDSSLFPVLNNRKEWKTYKQGLESQADAQRVSDVLNESYTPNTPDEIELFKEKQTYMFAVFVRTMKADFAKKALADFDKDAQKAYAEIRRIAEKSTTAKAHSSILLTQITSERINDGTFQGTSAGFIIYWCGLVREYNDLVDSARQMTTFRS